MGIDCNKEKRLWTEIIIPKYSYQPHICPICHTGEFVLKESTGDDILNPYYLRYNNKPCRKKKILELILFLHFIKIYQLV